MKAIKEARRKSECQRGFEKMDKLQAERVEQDQKEESSGVGDEKAVNLLIP